MIETLAAHKIMLIVAAMAAAGFLYWQHSRNAQAATAAGVPVDPYASGQAADVPPGSLSVNTAVPGYGGTTTTAPAGDSSSGGADSGASAPAAADAPVALSNTLATSAATTDNSNPWSQPAVVSGGMTNADLPVDQQLAGVPANAYVISSSMPGGTGLQTPEQLLSASSRPSVGTPAKLAVAGQIIPAGVALAA